MRAQEQAGLSLEVEGTESAYFHSQVLQELEMPDQKQPTLANILRAVNSCTASINTLKDQFGGLRGDVSLLCQDLQRIQERTTAMESRVSDVENQLHPLAWDSKSALQLAKEASNRAEDMENCL